MDTNLFRYIWLHTRRDQLWIVAVIIASMPFMFMALDLPKLIVNGPIQGRGFPDVMSTQRLLSFSLGLPDWLSDKPLLTFAGFELHRVQSLVALSLMFLSLVCINGLFKYYINTFKGRLGERMLRRLRYDLVDRILRAPLAHVRKMKSAEVATMVKDEIEPLGGFIGDAFVQPVFLSAQALTALAFIIVQNAWLGAIAGGVVVVQAVFIPRLRRRLLELGKQQQLTARDLAGRVAEVVDGIAEVRTNDASNYERADIAHRLGRIYFIRYELYQRKFFVKFLNNFLAQLTPFLFFLIGGALAIRGRLDIGQLVAVIAAYKDLPGPIKELIDWDQQRQDVQIKYAQVAEQFSPAVLVAPERQAATPGPVPLLLTDNVDIGGLSLADDGGTKVLDHADLKISRGESVAAIGDASSGSSALAEALARLMPTVSGRIRIDDKPIDDLSEALTGRRIAYVGPDTYLRNASLRTSLLYGLVHYPMRANGSVAPTILREALASGNSALDLGSDWTDYGRIGATDSTDMTARLLRLLTIVDLEDDVFEFGLRSTGAMENRTAHVPNVRLLEARKRLRIDLQAAGLAHLVEPLDPERYHSQTTIGENLVFGAALDERFRPEHLADNKFVLAALAHNGLNAKLFDIGCRIAATVMELFAGLPSDHPFFERLSFVRADELPLYQTVLSRIGSQPVTRVSAPDRARMLGLAFGYVEARHRLGLLDDATRQLIIQARRHIHDDLPDDLLGAIAFYEPDAYNHASTLEHNILFGRVIQGVADASIRVRRVMRQTLEELDLRRDVLEAGLEFAVGPAGKRLTQQQRQKVGLARALLKQPDLLIINRGLSALSTSRQRAIMAAITAATRATTRPATRPATRPGRPSHPPDEVNKKSPFPADGQRTRNRRKQAGNGLTTDGPASPADDFTAGAVFWVPANPALEQVSVFDRVVVFEDGRLIDNVPAASLADPESKVLKFLV